MYMRFFHARSDAGQRSLHACYIRYVRYVRYVRYMTLHLPPLCPVVPELPHMDMPHVPGSPRGAPWCPAILEFPISTNENMMNFP